MTKEELKDLRIREEFTQEQLGIALGMPIKNARSRISDYETGRRAISKKIQATIGRAFPALTPAPVAAYSHRQALLDTTEQWFNTKGDKALFARLAAGEVSEAEAVLASFMPNPAERATEMTVVREACSVYGDDADEMIYRLLPGYVNWLGNGLPRLTVAALRTLLDRNPTAYKSFQFNVLGVSPLFDPSFMR